MISGAPDLRELDPELLPDEDDDDEGERRFLSSLRRDGLGERVRLRPKGSTGLQGSMRQSNHYRHKDVHAGRAQTVPWRPMCSAWLAAVALT